MAHTPQDAPIAESSHSLSAFDAGASAWDQYAQTPLGSLREELILEHLCCHLPSAAGSLAILDVGAGTGGYALPLARRGHRVALLDFAPSMLAIARQRFATDAALLERATFCCAPLEALPEEIVDARYDALLLHTVLEYVADPWDTLARLVPLLKPGGLLSLVIVNRHAEAMRWALAKRDPTRALQAICGDSSEAELFGLSRHVLDLADARQTLRRSSMIELAHYGIRIFADHYPADELARPEVRQALVALELAAAGRDPYRQIARYHHVLAVRPADTL